MNAAKRQRLTMSSDDMERLLFFMEDARGYIIKYGSAQLCTSQVRALADQAKTALDHLVGQITGDGQCLWSKASTAGGDDGTFHSAAVLEKSRDAGGAEGVIANLGENAASKARFPVMK